MGLKEIVGAEMAQRLVERMDRRIEEMMDQFMELVPVAEDPAEEIHLAMDWLRLPFNYKYQALEALDRALVELRQPMNDEKTTVNWQVIPGLDYPVAKDPAEGTYRETFKGTFAGDEKVS